MDNKTIKSIEKMIATQEELVYSVNRLLKGSYSNNVNSKDRFLVKKDITLQLLKSENKLLANLLKVNKEILAENKKKRGSNLFKGLSALLGLGGLAGYLLTGEKGHLFSLIKGLKRLIPNKIFIEPLDKLIQGTLGFITKGVKKLFSLDIIAKPLKGFFDGIGKFFKPITGMIDNVGKVLKPVMDIFGKGLEKVGGKGLGKVLGKGSKTLLKKIPGVGTILGLYFGIERFKTGDVVGGIGEIASGVASMFPGVGTGISLLIDGLLMLKDFNVFGDVNKKAGDFIKNTYTKAKEIPVIGTIITSFEALYNFVKNPLDSAMELANVADSFLPGSGDIIRLGVGWIQELKNSSAFKKVGEIANKIKDFGKNLIPNIDLFPSKNMISKDEITAKKKRGENLLSMWEPLIDKYSKEHPTVPKELIKAIIMQESGGDPYAEGSMTKYGTAKGLGQFIDPTAKQYIPNWKSSKDSYDPEKNIAGMFNYMDYLIKLKNGDAVAATAQYLGTGYDPVSKLTPEEYAKQVFDKMEKINQNKTVNKNVIHVPLKKDVSGVVSVELGDQTVKKLAKEIAVQGKDNVTTVESKNSLMVNGRN